MNYLVLNKDFISATDGISISLFWFLVNESNYTKKELDIIYGITEKVTYTTMNGLLDKAFGISDYRTISQLCKIYS